MAVIPPEERVAVPRNVDHEVVRDFGEQWNRFDQSVLSRGDFELGFDCYFRIFPWDLLPQDAAGFDLGCGSGRWAVGVAPRVGTLHCIDPSAAALEVAKRNLRGQENCVFHHAAVDRVDLPDGSMDFGYSLGVLHHIPDTAAGIRACVAKLKRGAPFLLYLYYAFDNRPRWFRALWRVADLGRTVISRLPGRAKQIVAELIAIAVYWPLARTARLLELLRLPVGAFPLSAYRNRSFHTMRTDSLDRFGTRLERRFTRAQVESMMVAAGLSDVRFSDREPFWCATGRKL